MKIKFDISWNLYAFVHFWCIKNSVLSEDRRSDSRSKGRCMGALQLTESILVNWCVSDGKSRSSS